MRTKNFPIFQLNRLYAPGDNHPEGTSGVSASGGDLCASPVIRDRKAVILPPDRRHHYSGCAVRVGVTGWPPQQTIWADMPVATRLFYESTRRCFHRFLRTASEKSLTIPPPRISAWPRRLADVPACSTPVFRRFFLCADRRLVPKQPLCLYFVFRSKLLRARRVIASTPPPSGKFFSPP